MALVTSIVLPFAMPAFAAENFTEPTDVAIVPLDNSEITLRYEPYVGFYLAQEIPQGLEFTILGEGDFALMVDEITGDYFLVEDASNMDAFLDDGLRSAYQSIMPLSQQNWNSPSTPINVVSMSRVVHGVWWGGIFRPANVTNDAIGSVTIAQSFSSEGEASVTPAGWPTRSGGWRIQGQRSEALLTATPVWEGIDRANWNLRAR